MFLALAVIHGGGCDEAAVLTKRLDAIVRNDRFPLSPRIQTLCAILMKLRTGSSETSPMMGGPSPPGRPLTAAEGVRAADWAAIAGDGDEI